MERADEIRQTVREYYAERASGGSCCSGAVCCGATTEEDLLGSSLGCGTLADAALQPGETVVDLGSGRGGDVLRAAQHVGARGRAIGIDMTPEMVWAARESARKNSVTNTEFYLGEIEHVPLADSSTDVVISNCVINLVPDKAAAFTEAFRILRPGGRLIVADMVSDGPLPEAIRADPTAWAACISGAVEAAAYLALIRRVGFEQVETVAATPSAPGQVFSVTVRAIKPSG